MLNSREINNFPLTHAAFWESLEFPTKRGVTVAFAMPHMAKRAVFFILAVFSPRFWVGINMQGDVRMSARLRQLLLGWGASPCFFYVLKSQTKRCCMSSQLQSYLPKVQSLDAPAAAFVFRKIYEVADDLSCLETFLTMADKTGTEIEVSAVPSIIRQARRMVHDLYDAYVLICPSIDQIYARDLLADAGLLSYRPTCHVHAMNNNPQDKNHG